MRNALLVVSAAALGLIGALAFNPDRPAEAQTVQGEAGGGPAVIMGVGGAAQNQNDNCWVLFKEKAKTREGKEIDRVSLCLYKIAANGQSFDLVDAREITYDGKLSQLASKEHNPKLSPKVIKKEYEEQLEREEREARERLRQQQAQQNK